MQLSGELAGFNVAVGLGGIHALQCINRETRESIPWLGCPDDVPKTERLFVRTRIIALEADFDVGKPYVLILTFCLLTLGGRIGLQNGQNRRCAATAIYPKSALER